MKSIDPMNPETSMNNDASGKDERKHPTKQRNKKKNAKVPKQKKMDYVKEEEEIMVRLFGGICPSSELAWDKWAKEFNEWMPDDTGPPQTLASLKRKWYRMVSARPPTGAQPIDPLIEQASY